MGRTTAACRSHGINSTLALNEVYCDLTQSARARTGAEEPLNRDHREQSSRVAAHFGREWRDYDDQIRKSIPFYDQALSTLVSVIDATGNRPRRILDLGVGTGNLAYLLLRT